MIAVYLISLGLVWKLASLKWWYYDDPLFEIAFYIKSNIFTISIVVFAVGIILISLYYFILILKYIEEIVDNTEKLLLESEEKENKKFILSNDLKELENDFNLIQEKNIRNHLVAKEAERRKNDLIVYLAHDLKTPLTSIIGYLSILKDEKNISKELCMRYSAIALKKAIHLENLINEFFEITRYNLSNIILEKQNINITTMLRQILFEFNPIIKEKGMYWEIKIEENQFLFCDPSKMERVFDNLIRNAVNYGDNNTAIDVSLSNVQGKMIIQFINYGREIPKEKLDKIFDQFYRIDSSRSTSTGGSGLGLAITKEIVERHGGKIYANSFDHKIIFRIEFPSNEE